MSIFLHRICSAWISMLLQLKQHPWMQGLAETSCWSSTYTGQTLHKHTTHTAHTAQTHYTHCTHCTHCTHYTHCTPTAGLNCNSSWPSNPLSRGQIFLACLDFSPLTLINLSIYNNATWADPANSWYKIEKWELPFLQHHTLVKNGWLWLFIIILKNIHRVKVGQYL